jgi:hypothetical protein
MAGGNTQTGQTGVDTKHHLIVGHQVVTEGAIGIN